ncbi:DUF2809 domain-containing protein [Ferruginibacter sp. SUN106]|uniref:ribosomal maturation YjgA family protein n=1 Tax=Ferruginibacter sp. SUN106 TaxID=2978348 RepID=UPI003D36EED5
MNISLKFSARYFILAILLLVTEILIAVYVHDAIIRPYIGDLLVVILIYCTVKAFINSPVLKTAIAVLLFSFLIETLQYFKIVEVLGLQHSKLARVIIGTSFEWVDIAAYIAGVLVVLFAEKLAGNLK